MIRLYTTLFFLIITQLSWAQNHVSSDDNQTFQFGISAKATVEFQKKGGFFTHIGLNAGLGTSVIDNAFYPAFHLECQLYQGGLGTQSGSGQPKSNLTGDLIGSFLVTGGFWYQGGRLTPSQMAIRNQPLYYFTDMVQPALQNPYRYSASVGTNLVIPFDGDKFHQQVGFINMHAENFQFGYYNDGGGFQNIFIGDGEDRYYTGGGLIALTFPTNVYVSSFVASYNKFSGFGKHAFDLSGSLGNSYVNYKEPNQQYYNKSYWNFAFSNARTGLSAFWRINNTYNRFDFQNTIHYSFSYAYHQIPYPRNWSFGGSYFNSVSNISQ